MLSFFLISNVGKNIETKNIMRSIILKKNSYDSLRRASLINNNMWNVNYKRYNVICYLISINKLRLGLIYSNKYTKNIGRFLVPI